MRTFIACHECDERRVIFSQAKLTNKQEHIIQRIEEEVLYSCVVRLSANISKNYKSFVIKEGVNCKSPIEIQ